MHAFSWLLGNSLRRQINSQHILPCTTFVSFVKGWRKMSCSLSFIHAGCPFPYSWGKEICCEGPCEHKAAAFWPYSSCCKINQQQRMANLLWWIPGKWWHIIAVQYAVHSVKIMWNGYLHAGYKNMIHFVLSLTTLCGKLQFFILLKKLKCVTSLFYSNQLMHSF